MDLSGTGIIDPMAKWNQMLSTQKSSDCDYDKSKGPLRDKSLPLACEDGSRMATAAEIAFVTKKYGKQMDLNHKVNFQKVTVRILEKTIAMLENNLDAYVTGGKRDRNHELERYKSKPGPHVDPDTAEDYGLPSKIEGQFVGDWRNPNYSLEKTQEIVDRAFAVDPGVVPEHNFFNDPHIVGVVPKAKHNNHVHIGFSKGPLSPAAQKFLRTGDRTELDAAVKAIQDKRREAAKHNKHIDHPQKGPACDFDEEVDDCDAASHHKTPLEMFQDTVIDDPWITEAIQRMQKNQREQAAKQKGPAHHKTPLEMYQETKFDDPWIAEAIQQMQKNQREQEAAKLKK